MRSETGTHHFFQMALAEDSICDLDSGSNGFSHDFITKEDGYAEVTNSRSALSLNLEGGWK